MKVFGIDTLHYNSKKNTMFFGESKLTNSVELGIQQHTAELLLMDYKLSEECKLITLRENDIRCKLGVVQEITKFGRKLILNDNLSILNLKKEDLAFNIAIVYFIAHGEEFDYDLITKKIKNFRKKIKFKDIKVYCVTLPIKNKEGFNYIIGKLNIAFRSFVQGTLFISLIIMILSSIFYGIIGLPSALLFGLICGITNIIPYIGPFIAFFPGLIIAFQDSTFMAVKFVIVWFAVQLLHGDLVIPRVMGDRLQIHPITILIVLLVMGDLMGIVGVIFGIPIYTLVKLLVTFIFRKFKQRYNKFYGDKGEYEHSSFSEEDLKASYTVSLL